MYIHAEREFKILKRLEGNPTIIEGIEYLPEFLRSRGYIVIEKVKGLSCLDYVVENGSVDEASAKHIIRQVIEALDYMHTRGVVHRDMNPTNVFITDEKTKAVKMLDFNVSKLIDGIGPLTNITANTSEESKNESPSRTRRISLMPTNDRTKYSLFTKTGTPIYSAPEFHSAFRYR